MSQESPSHLRKGFVGIGGRYIHLMVVLLWIIVKSNKRYSTGHIWWEWLCLSLHYVCLHVCMGMCVCVCVYDTCVCAWKDFCTWFIVHAYDGWFSPKRSPPNFFLFISLHGHRNMFDVTTSCGEIYDRWTNYTKNISNIYILKIWALQM